MSKPISIVAFLILLVTSSTPVFAWVYPEHRHLSYLGIQGLPASYRIELDKLWAMARTGHESRLSPEVTVINNQGGLLDFATWAAVSGDHSCSPSDMLSTVLYSKWILRVDQISASFGETLFKSTSNTQRINAAHLSDVRLMKADEQYVTRAGSNSVHFLLPRNTVSLSMLEYFLACTAENATPNSLATYAWFHSSALQKAARLAGNITLSDSEKNELALSALADEAFAAHFLQDIFAAGHITGSWGKQSQKKGTHDHYNEAGLEIETWQGKRRIVMGDGFMTEEEALMIGTILSSSLQQMLDAATGKLSIKHDAHFGSDQIAASSVNICQLPSMPPVEYDMALLNPIISQMPIPGLRSGPGSMPRVNAELGPFIGVSAALIGQGIGSGFGVAQTDPGAIGGMEANFRAGVGLDGLLNKSGDGLLFLQVGWKQESASTNTFYPTGGTSGAGNSLVSAIPPRSSYNLRIRLPFFVIPGDLILASPLYLFAPKTYTRMAETAVNGGLLRMQSGIATKIGRFQFVLGREVGFSFYGLKDPKDFIFVPVNDSNTTAVEYRSTKIDFPVIEYTPTRSFSQTQSSTLMIQFSVGVDVPYRVKNLVSNTAPIPDLRRIVYAGMRVIFNWRRYL